MNTVLEMHIQNKYSSRNTETEQIHQKSSCHTLADTDDDEYAGVGDASCFSSWPLCTHPACLQVQRLSGSQIKLVCIKTSERQRGRGGIHNATFKWSRFVFCFCCFVPVLTIVFWKSFNGGHSDAPHWENLNVIFNQASFKTGLIRIEYWMH